MSTTVNFGQEDIQYAVLFHKVTRPSDHVVWQRHVKYFSCCITTIASKLGKVVSFNSLSQITF